MTNAHKGIALGVLAIAAMALIALSQIGGDPDPAVAVADRAADFHAASATAPLGFGENPSRADSGVAIPATRTLLDDGGIHAPTSNRVTQPPDTRAEVQPAQAQEAEPPPAREQLKRASFFHDFVILRRHEIRQQIEEIEASDDHTRLSALRRELEVLEHAEPQVQSRVDELAREVRATESQADPE